MREIKFRVFWHKDKITTSVDTIEFLHGGIRVSDGCYHIGWQGKDCELREFTGLHDKNGREIYEGDILRFTHEREDFINTDARIAVEIPKIYYMIDNPYNHSFEVIGNIYENETEVFK